MKMTALLCLLPLPALAWEFEETTICRLTHTEAAASVEVTFDPAAGLYSITLTQSGGWPDAPVFQLRFDGPRPFIISTDRHELTNSNQSLTVIDTGFGNVLDGIQFNQQMTALVGEQAVSVSTASAADAMTAFRNCPAIPTS